MATTSNRIVAAAAGAARKSRPVRKRAASPGARSVGRLCDRAPVTVPASITIVSAAKLMRDRHVGTLIVVDPGKARRPRGIVTDRDLVVGILAFDLDGTVFTVGDVMSRSLATLRETDSVEDAISRMRRRGVRRLPVVRANGGLAGIVALDDLLEHLAAQLTRVVEAIGYERQREVRTRKRAF